MAAWRPAAVFLLAATATLSPASEQNPLADVPYVPTPAVVVEAMLKLAQVGPRDFVVDLGSGDGRILIAAAKQRGAQGFGVEIDGALVSRARGEAQRQGVADRVKFVEQDLFVTEIARATVMTLYLYPRLLMRLRPRFFGELRPGTRIVSHEFDMEDWTPDERVTVSVPDKPYGPPRSDVLLWYVPVNAAGEWRWRLPANGAEAEYELALSQTFQMLEGQPRVGGAQGRMEQGRMRGEEIRFVLAADAGGRMQRQEYAGRVDGDTITGKVRVGGGEQEWKATRVRRGSIKLGNK